MEKTTFKPEEEILDLNAPYGPQSIDLTCYEDFEVDPDSVPPTQPKISFWDEECEIIFKCVQFGGLDRYYNHLSKKLKVLASKRRKTPKDSLLVIRKQISKK